MKVLAFTLSCGLLMNQAAVAQSAPILLWPHGAPDPVPMSGPEKDRSPSTLPGHNAELTNISVPTITVYAPAKGAANSGAGLLVFPGGGYQFLNMKNAGTEPCEWANSVGMTCFLVKYRVPLKGYYPEQHAMLDDGQQAVRLVRARAAEFGVDPNKIGAMGFSAGGNLSILLSTHPDDPHVLTTAAANDVPMEGGKPVEARLDFAIHCWPAFTTLKPDETKLDPIYKPNGFTPPTFIIQAEDDPQAGRNGIVFYRGLMDAKVPAELHYYQTGHHAFGMHPDKFAQARWADIAANWLRFNKVLPGWVAPKSKAEFNPEAPGN